MYFWNVNGLTRDLQEGRVGHREQMMYLAAWAAYNIFAEQNARLTWEVPSELTIGRALTLLVIAVGGVFLCWRANCRGDGEHFVERFICISWPIRVKLTVVLFALAGLVALVMTQLGIDRRMVFEHFVDPSGVGMAVAGAALDLVYYLWVRRQVVQISRRQAGTAG